MSKVVILAINAKYVHSSLAVWVLASGVSMYSRFSHDVKIIEATIHQAIDDIARRAASFEPDVVGVSAYIWNAGMLPDLLKLLRNKLANASFVLGGPEASHNAAYWLEHGADHVLHGEGEYSFPPLLDALAKGNPAPTELTDPGEPIDPYNEAYFDALGGRIAYLETSRGCPFSCSFCLSARKIVTFFPLETVIEQIYKLSRSGTQTIKLVDRTFNCDVDRAYELLEHIIRLDVGCCFHFEVAADLFDDRTLTLLRQAPPGRIQLEAGIQSFFEPAINATSRQTDIKRAEGNIRALLQAQNIHIHVDLIAGLPYETLANFQDSFNRAYALGAHTLQLGFLKLLHGSVLRDQAEDLSIQYSSKPPYEITSSPWISADDLRILRRAENALRHTHNKGRFLSVLEYALSVSGMDPFSLFRTIGEASQNHGTRLEVYARQIYECCIKLPGADVGRLRDFMVCDWLAMVKGKNMPVFLKRPNRRYKQIMKIAEKQLGHGIARGEAAILISGMGVFVDSAERDPVTGLYRLHFHSF
ncbi:MAG: B12-binding domain-containing radical SAM protein [Oscillospiraceae bacterium]|jgi:hypothetical protein|nr:B12-binding domain-containing radical SAM protein [Oscillospiraceae bacterium]